MTVEIKFDAHQNYQLDAINSVVGLFDGQENLDQGVSVPDFTDDQVLDSFQEPIFGNSLSLTAETVQRNLARIQDREVAAADGTATPMIPAGMRRPLDPGEMPADFSVEMETGTGKTYVYLRTIADLHQKYGFSKFVIVVPRIAVREGVLSSLKLLKDHIRELYDGLQYDYHVYDSNALTRVRQFATASHLQIMVVNVAAMTGDKESRIIHRPTDAMNGYAPIEFLRACRPIVVMDEPQSLEGPVQQRVIDALAPLVRLRYSATHRSLQHLVYRLTPVDAYDLRLVKRIGVLSITQEHDVNDDYVEIVAINPTPGNVTATAVVHKATKQGTKPTRVTLRKDDDLCEVSGGRGIYEGWIVEDIHADTGVVEFGNGRRIRFGSSTGEGKAQLQRLQIRQAIESHFEKELELVRDHRRGLVEAQVKPLSLFFIDKVANYHPADGKFRVWFEDEYEAVCADGRFRTLRMPPVEDVHNGYFATSAKGVPKDTNPGQDTKDAADAFELIMRDKERLLSLEEPLRFIFSHSALAEGWDNPNVFTICNLQDGKSEMRRRQQIGRGLRLPVMANGERCRVDEVNLLTVIANEDFSKFADGLQKEIEDETGVRFDKRIVDLKRDRVKVRLKKDVLSDPIFRGLWKQISPRTTYYLDFETNAVVVEALRRINEMPDLEPVRFRIDKAEVDIDRKGVAIGEGRHRGVVEVAGARRIPDILSELCRRVPLSRATIARILTDSGKLDQVRTNPSVFVDQVAEAMSQALYAQAVNGIVYRPRDGQRWSAENLAELHQAEAFAEMTVPVDKSITDQVICDSEVEKRFAKYLDAHKRVRLFLKLPGWFKVPTPLGSYNPDWAIVKEESEGTYLYLVHETKGGSDIEKLRFETEGWKIRFGEAHFKSIKVDYFFGDRAAPVLEVDYEHFSIAHPGPPRRQHTDQRSPDGP